MPNNPLANNPYLPKTENNFKKTLQFVINSQGSITFLGKTDTDVNGYSLELLPESNNVKSKYLLWYVAKHLALSATSLQNEVEAAMPAHVKKLETAVLSAYDEGTPNYKTIFSKPKSFLYEGETQSQKLINLQTVSMILENFSPLAPAKLVFDTYVTEYDDTLKASADAQSNLTEASKHMENARINWCVEALGITGKLLTKFKLNPEIVGDIFDLSIFNPIHSHIEPDKGTLVVIIPRNCMISAEMVFDPLKSYYLHNSGICILKVGSASTPDLETLLTYLTLDIDETIVASGQELGDLINRYLLISNENLTLNGELKIKEAE